MTVPVLETWLETDGGVTESATLTATKPSGVVANDFLVIFAWNDSGAAGPEFSDNLTGWDFQGTVGNSTTDVYLGVFTRVATGSESATESIVAASVAAWGTYYLRISGADVGGTPVNQFAAETAIPGAGPLPALCPSITTDVDDCLVSYACGWDGQDTAPFALGNENGWTSTDEISDDAIGSASTGLGITFGARDLATKGPSGNAEVMPQTNDGASYCQIAFAPPGVGGPVLMPASFSQQMVSF